MLFSEDLMPLEFENACKNNDKEVINMMLTKSRPGKI
jgi:hypothetical protein